MQPMQSLAQSSLSCPQQPETLGLSQANKAVTPRHPCLFRLGDFGSQRSAECVCASGWPDLDAELSGHGWPQPGLTEILCDHVGIGELSLLVKALEKPAVIGEAQQVLWVLPPSVSWIPYAPALAQNGFDLARLAIVRPKNTEGALWAAEQALKSGACRAVLLHLQGAYCNPVLLRRLLQSALAGDAIAWVIRPLAAAANPSPASLRLALHPAPQGALRVDLLKRRGLPPGKSITLAPHTLPCFSRESAAVRNTATTKSSPWLTRLLKSKATPSALVRERSILLDR